MFVAREDITLYSRFECKYLVHPRVVPEIRECITPFMDPDSFAALRPGNRYPVCSLYLDSEDLRLYQETNGGIKDRFKLRLRTYSEKPTAPVFFEIKRRLNNTVRKTRAKVSRDECAGILNGRSTALLSRLSDALLRDMNSFMSCRGLIEAKPVLRVKYLREAYQSKGGDPVRITIDTDLMHQVTLEDNLSRTQGRWIPTPLNGVIVEIKFTDYFPSWVQSIVHAFGLRQQSVPKYVWSMDQVLDGDRETVLSLAGFTLPPRAPQGQGW